MKKTDPIQKGLVIATLIFLVVSGSGQAMVRSPTAWTTMKQGTPLSRGVPTGTWEDNFDDASKIDPAPPGSGASDNYVVSGGHVSMAGTYPIWVDPSFTRMKPITLTNTGSAKNNYVLKLTIAYDSDMNPNYNDLRFKHESNPSAWLSYWIEFSNSTQATVWVKLTTVPAGTSMLYLFYGNSLAPQGSNFVNTFGTSWTRQWSTDVQVSSQPSSQNAVDPDLAFGNNKFLATWEEGTLGPVLYYRGIEGKIYDTTGAVIVPTFVIQENPPSTYRYENPSAAYGGGNFFVAYNYYVTPVDASTQDVHAKIVHQDGSVGSEITVCSQTSTQNEPNVVFDPVNNRFTVVWQDARSGDTNFNLYARQYDTSGGPVGAEHAICTSSNNQLDPWIAYDPIHGRYLIAWEDGVDSHNGPFSIYAGLFDYNLNAIGSPWLVATGTASLDNDWPCVMFSELAQRFLVTWNVDDISSGDYYGNAYGRLYSWDGTVVGSQLTIDSGEYHDTQIEPYLAGSFLVAYNSLLGVYGKLVGPDGAILDGQVQLASSSAVAPNTPSTAVGASKLFIGWEDERISSTYDYVYANLDILSLLPLDSDVTGVIGAEVAIILTAHVTSIAITPAILTSWTLFYAIYSGTVTFSILDGVTGAVLIPSIVPGGSLAGLTATSIRLKATFSRANPATSPYVDKWNVTWVQNRPPAAPSSPSPANGSTGIDPTSLLSWTGGDPDGDSVTYDVYLGNTSTPGKVAGNITTASYSPSTLFFQQTYYWRIVAWDEHGSRTPGPLWQFTTDAYPYTPADPSPADHAAGVEITTPLSWTGGDPDPDDTVVYDVYFGTVTPPPPASIHQYATSYDPSPMNYLQTYYWQIVAIDPHGASSAGPIWNFTTVYAPDTPPYVPSSPNPSNGSINVPVNTSLSWTGGDPDPMDTVTYDVYFGTTNPPPQQTAAYPNTTYDPGDLEYLTHYYWQIVSWDNRGASTPGPVWQFTTAAEVNYPPYLPSDPSPANHATNVSISTNLSWNGGDPNHGDTVTYDVYFGTSTTPPLVVHNQSATTYDPGLLEYETTYYWKIVSWDNHGLSTQGSRWDFKTEKEFNYPPIVPGNPVPADGSVNVSATVHLSWTSGDPNPHDTVTFDVYFGNISTPPLVSNNQTATSYNPGRLQWNMTYYWRIVAWDNHGANSTGPLWRFTVMQQPPDMTPPSLRIVKPEKALYLRNVKICRFPAALAISYLDVTANATDNETGVNRVQFSIDGVPQNTTVTEPYTWQWTAAGFFFYTLTVTSWDNAGNKAEVSMRVWKFL